MEWLEAVKQHWFYGILQFLGVGALMRAAALSYIKEKARIRLHQNNSEKIDWVIKSIGHLAHAQGVTLEEYVKPVDRSLLKSIFQPEMKGRDRTLQPKEELCPPKTESVSSSPPCKS